MRSTESHAPRRLTWVLASTLLAAGYAVVAQTPAPTGQPPAGQHSAPATRQARRARTMPAAAAAGAVAGRI